jgi:AcrR family transcriptional regulator
MQMHVKRRSSNNPSGRPRSVTVTENIHAAVFTILEKGSFENLSFDAIANEAGVTRPALYRRYASVGQIALAALQALGPVILPMPSSKDVKKDLCSYLNAVVRSLDKNSAVGKALRGALASAQIDDDYRPQFAMFIEARRRPVIDRLRAWNRSLSEVELEFIADALFGPILYRLLIRQVSAQEEHVRKIATRALGTCVRNTNHERRSI